MARFEIDGIDDLNKAFSGLGNVPESVVSDAVTSMARVAAEKIKASGETMRVRSDEAPQENRSRRLCGRDVFRHPEKLARRKARPERPDRL